MNVLMIVDVQNDFCPGGALATDNGESIIPTINKLAGSDHFGRVVASQDWHPADHISFASQHDLDPFTEYHGDTLWPDHCVQGTQGAQLHSLLDQSSIGVILRKGMDPEVDSYSVFFENDGTEANPISIFDKEDKVYLAGIATDVCVKATALDAVSFFQEVFVVRDACSAVSPEGEEAAIKEMADNGIKIIESKQLLEM